MDATPDEALVDAWRLGDKPAGAQLFDRYFVPVSRFFRNKLPDQAEDLIQQTFAALLEGRDRMRTSASFRSYLFGIAHNLLRAQLRTLGRGRAIDPLESSFAELAPSPSALIGERAEQRLLLHALRRLPIEHQIALELHYWEGLNAAEIAEIMEVPHSTMRSRLGRARELLERMIAELADNPGLLQSTLNGLDAWAQEVRGQLTGAAAR
ncbi:RNA polymerase sigma-70 factor [Enhygromyxa salina]|uniref:RNA polymerase sigma-70 factor n=1 Tax=Enhygromyxa salina TaxID=215803 RepID=A0A0C2CZF7_9BACT|nr:sigma-70 family RNA polymerase sigma factor [Enhygromyxa salina]KIG16356.1 RNA polymerase sigma-70 factor [Enhygromyxa salina]